jgi:hypothetical protein
LASLLHKGDNQTKTNSKISDSGEGKKLIKLLLSTNRNTNNSMPAIRPDDNADKELLLRNLCLP